MDFNLKQWRLKSEDHHQEDEEQSSNNSLKLPKLELFDSHYQQSPVSASSVLPLFVTDSSDHHPNKIPKMASSYFSVGQWQELELQALIYRHMISGAAVPPELLHLVKKSISPQYYMSHPLNQYYPHYQPALMQSGYWGRGAMDPEPGRCRRTDGKKWRCSRDVVTGQKYCERHVHRGRNRSRKPVEIPTSITTTATQYGNNGGESLKKFTTATTNIAQPMSTGGVSSGVPHFTLSGSSPSMDLLHLNGRPSDSITEVKTPFEAHNEGQGQPHGARTLHFFDDWPRSLHESAENSTTNLSISMPGNASSDFSLKLGTGVESNSREGERPWGATWGTNVMHPMGGPLAEALRSSASNTSSPTSVLHRLRGSASESYISS